MRRIPSLKLIPLLIVLAIGVGNTEGSIVEKTAKLIGQGDAMAQYFLGSMHANGKGVQQDYQQAAMWYTRAAEQGHAGAQSALADLYTSGKGIPQDYIQALKWANLAATNADENVETNSDLIARNMTPEQIAEAEKLAQEWIVTHQAKD